MAISSKEWLMVLLSENGASYYVDTDGTVKQALTPKPLPNMFDGWADIVINYGRSAKYLGIERSYTSTYKFVKDSATILRSLLYGPRSIESKVYLGMLKWNSENGIFELYYKAEIDLVQAVDDPLTGVSCEVMQDGPAKYLKNNDSVTYSIPCEGINVENDGIVYTQKINYFLPATDELTGMLGFLLPAVSLVRKEGLDIGMLTGGQDAEAVLLDYPPTYPSGQITIERGEPNYLVSPSKTSIAIRVQGTFQVNAPTGGFALYFFVDHPPTPASTVQEYFVLNTINTSVPIDTPTTGSLYVKNYDQVINVGPGGKLRLVWVNQGAADLLETTFTTTFDTRYEKTICPAMRPLELFKKLVTKLTNGRFQGASKLLTDNEHLVTTSGNAIRGLENPDIKTTFSDFFDSYATILDGAIGVNYHTQEILFERKDYFFSDTQLIDLGDVSNLNVEIDKNSVFNSIKVGYAAHKEEEAVAKEEVNAGHIYSSPITRIKKELNLMVPYRTDIFGIERLRAEFNGMIKKDAGGDNACFIINVQRTPNLDGNYEVYRAAYSSITGGSNLSSWYNIEQLSPKRILLANSNLVYGPLYSLSNELITFVSGDCNTGVISTLGGKTVVESGNVRVSDFGDSYFRPFLLKFDTKVAENVVALMQQAGRGFVSGKHNGVEFHGYVQDINVKPVFNESQQWTILCSHLTDPAIFKGINEQAIILENMGIISHKLPVKFVRLNANYQPQHHFKQMDTDWFVNRIGKYSQQQPYFQKWQTNDSFNIQFIVDGIASEVEILNCYGLKHSDVTLSTVANGAVLYPRELRQGTVDCSTLTPGTYYLKATFGTGDGAKSFISEPLQVAVDWPDTVLIEYSNTTNHTDLVWKAPYTGKIRVEGMIQSFRPTGRLSQYEDQPMDVVNLDNMPSRGYQLLIGNDFGVPDWMIDKLNRILPLDNVQIDGFAYSLDKDARLESIDTPGAPMSYWTVAIREASNKAGIAIDASGENDSALTVEYNINTKGFSSNSSPADQQDTIIQITEIE